MFFTSRKKIAEDGREIQINSDASLPQLHRLCTDFGFAVIGLCQSSATPKQYVLCEVGLVKGNTQSSEKVTPEFDSLSELESHVDQHAVEIVQKYLFGNDDDMFNSDMSVA